jgi:hypothetical protein
MGTPFHKTNSRLFKDLEKTASYRTKRKKCFICNKYFWGTLTWREDYCIEHETGDRIESVCGSTTDWAEILERREKGETKELN